MLGKLFKHELRATSRYFLPTYAALLVVALANNVFTNGASSGGSMSWIQGILGLGYGLLMASIFLLTVVVSLTRFRRNMLGDEGYLTHTLPVSLHHHIIVKLLVTVLWVVLSSIVSLVSVAFIALDGSNIQSAISAVSDGWLYIKQIFVQYEVSLTLFTIESLTGWVLSLIITVLIAYTALAVGQMASKRKTAVSWGVGVGLVVLLQIIFGGVFEALSATQFFGQVTAVHAGQALQAMPLVGLFVLSFMAAVSAVLYGVTYYVLSTRLNLE